jgi:hypothetical protein
MGDYFARDARASVAYNGNQCGQCERVALLVLTSYGWLCKPCMEAIP